ncbi:hypothetical protein SEA_ANON_96 [Gordonia phage Anon]|nr:hypothetical protein SEA_ANON_96 [Gordonia phage Anon]
MLDSRFYLLMLQIENVLSFSIQDTYEVPMFVDMAVKVDH